MKKRLGFVSNSSSSDYYVRYNDEEDAIPTIPDIIQYGNEHCKHYFVSRTDYNEQRKDVHPGICIRCGCFVDFDDITDEMIEEYDIEFNQDEEISGAEFSFFENPFAKEKFKNGVDINHDINDLIIL